MEEADHEDQRSSSTRGAVGFHLLPTVLLQTIFLHLALPEIPRLRSVSKWFRSLTSDPSFLHHYNLNSSDAPWLFVYATRWGQDAVLKGITTGSDRWFNFSIKHLLAPVVHRSDDAYFLTASGNVFLFAIDTTKELVSVNLKNMSVLKIPPSPLGPRDTRSWRSSGMKLVPGPAGPDHFRFFFLEYEENLEFWLGEYDHSDLFLFEYDSVTGKWQSTEVQEHGSSYNDLNIEEKPTGFIFLSLPNALGETITVAISLDKDAPIVVVSPTFVHYPRGSVEDRDSTVGLSGCFCMKICGDGNMLKVKSDPLSGNMRKKVTVGVELWSSLSSDGRHWEMISRVPIEFLAGQSDSLFGVMRGCLERRTGIVRGVLMFNYEGSSDIIWLSYEMERKRWSWRQLPDCNMKGANVGGIAFSSGLTLA